MLPPLASLLFFYWFPVAGWAFLIYVLSSVPAEKLPTWEIPYIDKFVHGLEFALLAFFLFRALKTTFQKQKFAFYALLTFASAFLYAVLDEWHQQGVPGRQSSTNDLFADAVGIFLLLVLSKRR